MQLTSNQFAVSLFGLFASAAIIYSYSQSLNYLVDTRAAASVTLAHTDSNGKFSELYEKTEGIRKLENYTNETLVHYGVTTSEHTYDIANPTCTHPVFKYVFIKTHKTGGTTMFFLLRRIVQTYDLQKKVATREPFPFVGGYPGRFKCEFMKTPGATIVDGHSRFDAEEMKKCFHPDTRYITILRKPWTAFQSGYYYYGRIFRENIPCFGMPISYINKGQNLDVNEFLLRAAPLLNKSVPFYFRFRNYQSHDLGIDPTSTDEKEIGRQIQELDKNMNLVMILEYFYESLVLLKELLCIPWTILSGTFERKSFRTKQSGFLTDLHKTTFENLNKIDIALYDHFNKTFWKRVDKYGRERMARDVEVLRSIKNRRKRDDTAEPDFQPDLPKAKTPLIQYMWNNSGSCFMPVST